jgi:hypothetical protein
MAGFTQTRQSNIQDLVFNSVEDVSRDVITPPSLCLVKDKGMYYAEYSTEVADSVNILDTAVSGIKLFKLNSSDNSRTTSGWQDFADSTTSTTPLVLNSGGGTVQLTNDNNGTLTDGNTNLNSSTTMRGVTDIWRTTDNVFSFKNTGVLANDTHFVRIHLAITPLIVPLDHSILLDFYTSEDGTGPRLFGFSTKLASRTSQAGVEQEHIVDQRYFVGESIMEGSLRLSYSGDTASSVRVIGWNTLMIRR